MNTITSRQNATVQNLKKLARDSAARSQQGLFICDGIKLLREAFDAKQTVRHIFWKDIPLKEFSAFPSQTILPNDLFDYVSPLKNSPGPLFTVEIPSMDHNQYDRAIILEDVQDPGNVGTIIRCANAMKIPAVVLCGTCADPYHPRTVRATMGAIFRQKIVNVDDPSQLRNVISGAVCGAALMPEARDIRELDLSKSSVVIGSEGHGLSEQMLALCDCSVIIPMNENSESLNAASAASILMWEMSRTLL